MTYTLSYTKLEGNAKRAKALEDTVTYLGWEEFVRISNAIVIADPKPTLEELRKMLPFVGVQGYPVQAWHELLFGQPTEQQEPS